MIEFFTEDINFNLTEEQKQKMRNWLNNVVKDFKKNIGEINIIFTSDQYLYKMNLEYLQHDYYTDVITFDYSDNQYISADIFISIDRVKENAQIYNKTFENELHRVIVHGILHTLGLKDSTDEEKKLMRQKEDFYLQKLQ